MANRVLRDTTDSEKVNALSEGAEVFFYRLFMKADDYGIHPANPLLLKSALFPLKHYVSDDMITWMGECIEQELVLKYRVKSKDYIQIVNFGQRLRSMRVKYPFPNPQTIVSNTPPESETESETESKKLKLESELLNSPAWIEQTAMFLKVTRDWVLKELKKFIDEQKLKEDFHNRDIVKLRQHFINVAKKLDKPKSTKERGMVR